MKHLGGRSPFIAMFGAVLALTAACEAPPGDEANDACGGLGEISIFQPLTPEVREATRQRLVAAKGRWSAFSTDSYSFETRRNMPATPWMRVTVRDGEIEMVESGESGDTVFVGGTEDRFRLWTTVDQLFDSLAKGLGTADWVMADFDPEMGYPTNVAIDPDLCAFDDEYGFEVRDLRVLSAEDPIDEM